MAIRKSLAVLLSAITLTFGVPSIGAAQGSILKTATVRGQVVDAGGRGATGMRIELVSDRLVVATTVSSTDGHFSFAGLPAGNYVVRTTVNGQPSGVRVSVTAGETAPTALLVLPSVATASPGVILAAVGPLLGSVLVVVSVVAGVVVIEAQAGADQTLVNNAVIAANLYIASLNNQLPPNPGQIAITPIFTFIPTTPRLPAS